ncbi:MAG: multicopper oxidase domain-containing protein [Gammaproteobacteria bacterium]
MSDTYSSPELPEETRDVSRRTALKLGATAGVAAALASRHAGAQEQDYPPPTPPPEPAVCSTRPTNSPATRPFVHALPIPPAAVPSSTLFPAPARVANLAFGEAPRADHQRWNEFLPHFHFNVSARPAMHQFHPDIPPSYVWSFNGIVPGPTFIAYYDHPIIIRFRNDLPVNHTGYGINEITTHLHNGHTASESDGFAGDYYGPGLWKDHHYPNVLAGYDQYPPKGDAREAMHTLWYHDHRHSFTAPNTYRGLTGMYLLFDDKDTGNERDTRPGALRLPSGYGVYDIPLILGDKIFCPDGQLWAVPSGFFQTGDKWVVNGAIQPFFNVQRRKYRFRIVNTGPLQDYVLRLSDGRPFKVIATDGNLLEHPLDATELPIGIAERFDVIIDFSNLAIGASLSLANNQAQFVGNAPDPEPIPGFPVENLILRFNVVANPPFPDVSQVPATLCTYPPVNLNEIARVRTWDFDFIGGQMKINGLIFDPDRSDANVRTGNTEKWILRNKVPLAFWTHPVHIHFEEFRVLSFNGAPPSPLQSGRKDVLNLRPENEAEIFIRFRDFRGKYQIHCHRMNHEDNFMLTRWDIGDNFPA